jgi:hypothetical protein
MTLFDLAACYDSLFPFFPVKTGLRVRLDLVLLLLSFCIFLSQALFVGVQMRICLCSRLTASFEHTFHFACPSPSICTRMASSFPWQLTALDATMYMCLHSTSTQW